MEHFDDDADEGVVVADEGEVEVKVKPVSEALDDQFFIYVCGYLGIVPNVLDTGV